MSTPPTSPVPGVVWTALTSEEFAALPRTQQARLNVIARCGVTLRGARARWDAAEAAYHRAIYDAVEQGVDTVVVAKAVEMTIYQVGAIRRQVAKKIKETDGAS